MKLLKLLTVLIVFGLTLSVEASVGCLNHQGKIVDWFAIITTPEKIHRSDPEVGYLYIDSTFKNHSFAIKRGYGNELNNPIHRTISQGNKTKLLSVVWNDQLYPAQGVGNSHNAHSKSYLVMNEAVS